MNSAKRFVRLLFLLITVVWLTPSLTRAETIDWVSYPTWVAGDVTGIGSSNDLNLEVTYTLISGQFVGRPIFRSNSAVIDDPNWVYDNNVVSALSAIGPQDTLIHYIVRFDYVNTGGLPAGGTLAIIDLEAKGSNIKVKAFNGGAQEPVDWNVSFVEVTGENAAFPNWNPDTATLTGNDNVDESTRNLVFLVTDRTVDAIEFEVTGPRDGIDLNTAAQTVLGPVLDSDFDGIIDEVDNCLRVANHDQTDTDTDNIGNACDPDFNNDCVVNFLDFTVLSNNFLSSNGPLYDLNNDGVINFIDISIFASYFLLPPGPSGISNVCDD